MLGQASGPGNLAVLLGSSTGRDGIGGVSVLASAGFGGGDEAEEAAKRPSVQVGDPYEEKRLIEACLELLDAKLVVGIQDLGGAGLVCATSETAARGGVGMDVDVSAVPRREPGMADYEVMTSESQERMLAIVTPDDLAPGRGGVRQVGGAGRGGRQGDRGARRAPPAGCGSSTASTARCSATCRPWPSARTPRSTAGRWPARPTRTPAWPTTPGALAAPVGLRPRRAGPAGRPVLGLPPVRPPALPQHGRGPGRRQRRAAPGRPRPAAVRAGPGPHHRLQPGLVRPRPPGRHGGHRGRGRPQPGLRRGHARRPSSTASTSATPSTPR